MIRPTRGFTLVEVLIVVVVLGILLGIGIVGMGGYTRWANNEARTMDIKTWASTFDTYKGRFYVWPAMPANNIDPTVICLGEFVNDALRPDVHTSGRCAKYASTTSGTYVTASGSNYTNLNSQVYRIGKIPQNGGKKTSQGAGPFVYLWQQTTAGTTSVTGVFVNYFEGSSCPKGLTPVATVITGPDIAHYASLNSLTSGTTACSLVKKFSYNPTGP